jgi:hypothetical protein
MGLQGWRSDDERIGLARGSKRVCHYHLIDSAVGDPRGFRDELFRSRRRALAAARARADWLNLVVGLRVEPLGGAGRYLITSGRPSDAGRTIEIEECDEPLCLEP